MSTVPNPHDVLFKAVFGSAEHARGALRSIVPRALAEAVDWNALELQPGSFVDRALSEQHSDLLYAARWRDGRDLLVYFLFEHQSAPPKDGLMAFRLFRYQVRIWEQWCAAHPKTKSLPMIIPIVMYHGATPWPEQRWFGDLIDVPADVRSTVEPYLVQFEYILNDLSQVSDDELRDGAMTTALAKLVAMCFKHARTRADFAQIFARWLDVVGNVVGAPHGLKAMEQVLCYILEVNARVTLETLEALLERELGPEAKDVTVPTGQELREQGRELGRREGRQEGHVAGRQEGHVAGRQEGKAELLLYLMRQRFGDAVDIETEQHIQAATAEQIEVWAARVLSATTLSELLAD